MHGVKAHTKFRTCKQFGDLLEIEQSLLKLGIVRYRIDDLNDHIAQFRLTLHTKIDVRRFNVAIAVDRLGTFIKGFGERLVGRTAIRHVVLDAEVAVGPAGVMARRQDDAAKCLVLPNHSAGGRCRENSVLSDHHPAEPCSGCHAQNDLDGDIVEVAPVAAEHQGLAFLP